MPALIEIDDVHKHYGAQAVLDGVTLSFSETDRVAVIGRNGAGKSTLCRMILGLEEPDAGRIERHPDLRLSWLEQQSPFQPGEQAGAFLERWSGRPAWDCARLAARFRVKDSQLASRVDELSGGFQTRLRLAAMLLREPNFLVLDEPTNYLDLSTLVLLEGFLSTWKGGYLVVSHDREFLKRTCGETLEVGGGKAEFFPGPLEDWLGHKELRVKEAERHNAATAARRRELEEFIARNKAKASKASQAQSKAKMLERLTTIEIGHASAEAVIRIPAVEKRQGPALRATALSIGYPERTVATGIDLDLERGSRIAVVGDNGQGKTTLLKTLAGALQPLSGSMRWGGTIRVGTYAQHVYAALDEAQTVLGHLEKCARAAPGHVTTQQVLDLAGGFLFRGDEVKKRIAVLSGGERARLCLAGLLLGRFDALLLDEPTNHLDFETVEALAEALASYDGTVLFTSHDRTFVSVVATSIIDVRDGGAKVYPDDYASYVWRLEKEMRDGDEPKREGTGRQTAAKPAAAAKPRDPAAENEARRRCKALERSVAALEQEQRELSEALAQARGADAAAAGRRLADVTSKLAAAEREWFALQERL